jgi:hypothetical protein
MRRWVISSALLANALASGVVLLVLLSRGGWGNAVDFSPVVAQILVVLAAVAFVLTLLLVPVLGISFLGQRPRHPAARGPPRGATPRAAV